jgi:N-acetyl-beta-hexosaminidase
MLLGRAVSCALLLAACSATGASQETVPFAEQAVVLARALTSLGARPELDPATGALRAVTFRRGDPGPGASHAIASDGRRVTVTAADSAGAATAAATLLRRARLHDGQASWAPFELVDGPGFPYRSFMVDMGRNPHGPETLRQVVDMLWFHRANVLHLHLTDDQLISWPSRAFPRLRDERAGWSWDDFVALEAYARARGVTIVPELDVPGHSTILRREYPEVFGETPTELASLPSAQHGVETLLDEMLSVFVSARHVHIGGDEAYGVPEELQRDFINRLHRFVTSRDRRTVVWEGPGPGTGENKVDEDVLHINWRTIDFPAQDMLDAGYEVVNAAWHPMYVVDHYPRTMFTAVDEEACFHWDPRRFGHIDPGMPTFTEPHVTDTSEGILGFAMPWWEGREENLMPLCLPRFAAVAEAAWDQDRPGGYAGFVAEIERTRPRLLALSGIELPPMPMADPSTQVGNLAFGRPVTPSSGASQPHFGPHRLTNGITDPLDHFLGFPATPEPLQIVIELAEVATIDRVVVFETARGASYERYRLGVSADGVAYEQVGASDQGTRGEAAFVEHRFAPRAARFVRLVTDGCQALTFPSFSRLCEVQVFAAE